MDGESPSGTVWGLLRNFLIGVWDWQHSRQGPRPGSVWEFAGNAENLERIFDGRTPLHLNLIGEESEKARVFALVDEKAYLLQIVLQEVGNIPRIEVAHLGSLEGGLYIEERGQDDIVLRFSHPALPGVLEVVGYSEAVEDPSELHDDIGEGVFAEADEFEQLRTTLRKWGETQVVLTGLNRLPVKENPAVVT
jgi:hypothetical protein